MRKQTLAQHNIKTDLQQTYLPSICQQHLFIKTKNFIRINTVTNPHGHFTTVTMSR